VTIVPGDGIVPGVQINIVAGHVEQAPQVDIVAENVHVAQVEGVSHTLEEDQEEGIQEANQQGGAIDAVQGTAAKKRVHHDTPSLVAIAPVAFIIPGSGRLCTPQLLRGAGGTGAACFTPASPAAIIRIC